MLQTPLSSDLHLLSDTLSHSFAYTNINSLPIGLLTHILFQRELLAIYILFAS